MTRNTNTYFGRLLRHLDEFKMGETVTRKGMLNAVYGPFHGRDSYCTTVDKWKRQLIVCGYLHETGERGVYEKGWNIPSLLTTGWLERAYSRELPNWERENETK